jgi:hypothetical protein
MIEIDVVVAMYMQHDTEYDRRQQRVHHEATLEYCLTLLEQDESNHDNNHSTNNNNKQNYR